MIEEKNLFYDSKREFIRDLTDSNMGKIKNILVKTLNTSTYYKSRNIKASELKYIPREDIEERITNDGNFIGSKNLINLPRKMYRFYFKFDRELTYGDIFTHNEANRNDDDLYEMDFDGEFIFSLDLHGLITKTNIKHIISYIDIFNSTINYGQMRTTVDIIPINYSYVSPYISKKTTNSVSNYVQTNNLKIPLKYIDYLNKNVKHRIDKGKAMEILSNLEARLSKFAKIAVDLRSFSDSKILELSLDDDNPYSNNLDNIMAHNEAYFTESRKRISPILTKRELLSDSYSKEVFFREFIDFIDIVGIDIVKGMFISLRRENKNVSFSIKEIGNFHTSLKLLAVDYYQSLDKYSKLKYRDPINYSIILKLIRTVRYLIKEMEKIKDDRI